MENVELPVKVNDLLIYPWQNFLTLLISEAFDVIIKRKCFFWFSAKSMSLFEFIKRMQGFIKGSEFYWLV